MTAWAEGKFGETDVEREKLGAPLFFLPGKNSIFVLWCPLNTGDIDDT